MTPGGLLRFALRACRDADKAAGLEVQLLNDSVLTVGEELRHAACKLAVLIDLEPVGLAACLHLDVGAELVDMLTGQVAAGDDDGLDGVALGKRREAATPRTSSVMSSTMRSIRRSGLSEPYFSMASR